MQDIKLNYDDVTLVPEVITEISSRSECNPYDENGALPIFASCMSSVVSKENYRDFLNNRIRVVIPRNYSFSERKQFIKWNNPNVFVAFSLAETENLLESYCLNEGRAYICIDLANGHMKKLLEVVKKLKKKWGDKVVIMTGNIANPETYREYEKAGVDFARCSIGTGAACVCKGTFITMADGSKRAINDIDRGDFVLTSDGAQRVLNTFTKKVKKTLLINNKIECTPDHKFWVVKKSDIKDGMRDEEIRKLCQYVEARQLNDEYLLVEE